MKDCRQKFAELMIGTFMDISTATPEDFDLKKIQKQIYEFDCFWKYDPDLIWIWAKEAVEPLVGERTNLDDNNSRNIENVMARSLFASCMRKISGGKASLEIIGKYQQKDHANVLFNVKKLENYSEKNYPHLYACILRFDAIFEERRHQL